VWGHFSAEIKTMPRFQALLKKAGFRQEAASLPNDERFLNRNTPGKSGAISSRPDVVAGPVNSTGP